MAVIMITLIIKNEFSHFIDTTNNFQFCIFDLIYLFISIFYNCFISNFTNTNYYSSRLPFHNTLAAKTSTRLFSHWSCSCL